MPFGAEGQVELAEETGDVPMNVTCEVALDAPAFAAGGLHQASSSMTRCCPERHSGIYARPAANRPPRRAARSPTRSVV